MSDVSADTREQLDMRSILAQLDRTREETLKFTAEQHKLMAEAKKYNRDPWFLAIGAFGAVLAAIIARLPEILHAFGVGH